MKVYIVYKECSKVDPEFTVFTDETKALDCAREEWREEMESCPDIVIPEDHKETFYKAGDEQFDELGWLYCGEFYHGGILVVGRDVQE